MDDFNNFFDDQRNNNDDDYNKRTNIYHTPDPKPVKEASKAAPVICIVMAVIMCLVVLINVIVLASLKNTIAQEYAAEMTDVLDDQYTQAINDYVDENLLEDVTESAATKAADALKADVADVANDLAVSVARIYMYKTSSSKDYSGLASAFLITDTDSTGTTQRYLLTNAHCCRYLDLVESTVVGKFGQRSSSYSLEWKSYEKILCYFENDDNEYTTEVVAYGSYDDTTYDEYVTYYGLTKPTDNDQADIALLRITGTQPSNTLHPSLKVAASDYSTRGTEVALIGNPQGLGYTTSIASGVISQTGITISSWGAGTFIMTDAAVNGGNSGGPMVDATGTVVGIVESKLVSTSIENMGFALSAQTINDFITWASKADNNELNSDITINYTKVIG